MHPLLAAAALALGVAVVKAITDPGAPNEDREWHAFLEVHTELHA